MSTLLSLEQFEIQIDKVRAFEVAFSAFRQTPEYVAFVAQHPEVERQAGECLQALQKVQRASERVLALRREGRCRDAIWGEAAESLSHYLSEVNRFYEMTIQMINASRAKQGLPALWSNISQH